MQSNFVVRLIDLTLLLLLSLLAVVRISEFEVELPVSQALEDQGAVLSPIEASVSSRGEVLIDGIGLSTAEELAALSQQEQRPVELRVDANADAQELLRIHQILEAADRPSAFVVEHRRGGGK